MSGKKKSKKKKTVDKKKIKPLYVLKIVGKNRELFQVVHHHDFTFLQLEAMDLVREHDEAYWEIYNTFGRYIDGSFNKRFTT